MIYGHTPPFNKEDPLNPDTWDDPVQSIKDKLQKALEANRQANEQDVLQKQVGGTHYRDMAIQPVEFITKNNLGFLEGNVIKYVSRWRNKNGVADLEKAKHYIELLIELEGKK